MKYVSEYIEPTSITKSFLNGKAEMSERQQAFLCGLIREKKPRKIVEVGVANGGTSAVILHCLEMLGYDYEMYSVDINSESYNTKGKKTGYLLNQLFFDRELDSTHHRFMIGKYLPEFLPEIGDDIDFVILDTVHFLPGEILDYIAVLPYCAEKATIVLHDISMSQKAPEYDTFANATSLLFSVTNGEKYLNNDDGYMNIGAFDISDNKFENIDNLFLSLIPNWYYWPGSKQIETYYSWYLKHYDKRCCELFKQAINMNWLFLSSLDRILNEYLSNIIVFCEKCCQLMIIYGCGKRGRSFYSCLKDKESRENNKVNFNIRHMISDGREKPNDMNDVIYYSEIKEIKCKYLIVLAADSNEIRDGLRRANSLWIEPPSYLWDRMEARYNAKVDPYEL